MKRTFIKLICKVEDHSLFIKSHEGFLACLWARLTAKKNMMDVDGYCQFKKQISELHNKNSARQN